MDQLKPSEVAAKESKARLARAAAVGIETLESRQLLHGVHFEGHINFQPAGAPVPAGYVADTGQVFGDRGNTLSYGWNQSISSAMRDRDAVSDQRLDTLVHTQRFGERWWELAVPNGQYRVHLVAGDPSNIDSVYKARAEGVLIIDGKPTSKQKFFEGTQIVTVGDGRLTLTNTTGADNSKWCYVDIETVDDDTPPPTGKPVISVTADDPSAAEAGRDPGVFRVSRSGDVSQKATIYFALSGNATNGSDFDRIGGSVTFAAGADSATVTVRPIDDSQAEGTESVTLKIYPSSKYTLGAASASVAITDNDSGNPSTGTTLVWRQVSAASVGRSEGMGTLVGGKLYVFGGYVNNSFRPTRHLEVYDPATDDWNDLASMPVGLSHAGVAAVDDTIWVVGGYPEGTTTSQIYATAASYKYDVAKNEWSSGPSLPAARGGGHLVLLGRELHFFGGSDIKRKDAAEHWSLNIDTPGATWQSRAPLPVPRNHIGGAVLNGKIYAVGGQNNQDDAAVPRANVDVWDPATDRWTAAAPLPTPPRSHISAATIVHNGQIIVMGGEGPRRATLNDVDAYDPGSGSWRSLTSLPANRLSGVAASLGDRLIFTGGVGPVNGGFTFLPTTWIGEFK